MSDKLVVIYTPFASDWHSPLEEVGSKEVRWKYFSDQNRPFWQRILKRPNFNTAFAGLRAVLYVKRTTPGCWSRSVRDGLKILRGSSCLHRTRAP